MSESEDKRLKHILLVDDNITSLKQAAALLRDAYKVSMVKSGQQALEFLEKITPHLILLDIEMPDMDGFETIQRIKLDKRFRKIPVIFLTGNHDTATETKGFECGAADFITKPYSQEVMLHRINLQIQLFDYQKRLETEKQRMTAELDVATKIQASMLPQHFDLFEKKGIFKVCANMQPAREVGGDFYDCFQVDEDHMALVIADVSGKGVPAAMFMVVAKTLIKTKTKGILSPGRVLEEVNNEIYDTNEEDMFVTLFLGILELSTGKFVCANAGHNPPIHLHQDGRAEYFSVNQNFILGVMPQIAFAENEIQLEEKDKILLYTDGITEAVDEKNDFYGEERFLNLLQNPQITAMSVDSLLAYIKEELNLFTGNTEQEDDITMLTFQYR